MPSPSKFKVGKEYKTRGNYRARIYATGADTTEGLIHGAVYDDGWSSTVWTSEGRAHVEPTVNGLDLMHVRDLVLPVRIVAGWVNIYQAKYTADGRIGKVWFGVLHHDEVGVLKERNMFITGKWPVGKFLKTIYIHEEVEE